jgi:phosphoglycerate dehydrogenase-like enzyme
MSTDSRIRIFYNSWVPDDLASLLKSFLPEGFELVTLDSDNDADRMEKIRDAQIAVVAGKPLHPDVLRHAENLRLVHHQGVGYQDTMEVAALKQRGIRLAITPGGTTESVAEHTLMLMLAALRHLPYADSQLRQGNWLINDLRLDSRELRFCKVGIIGMGRIGQAVARLLKAFGTTGCYYDPYISLPREEEERLGFVKKSFEETLSSSQIITLHIPCNKETRYCIDARAIDLMPDKAVIINAARGGLIDEKALVTALKQGRLAAAALDCFEKEPPDTGNELLQLDNVVLTPHIAAGTRDAITEKWRFIYRNIQSFVERGTLENEINL